MEEVTQGFPQRYETIMKKKNTLVQVKILSSLLRSTTDDIVKQWGRVRIPAFASIVLSIYLKSRNVNDKLI